ncbi:MAG: DUF3791 domain-containing protein [Clostridia bacterium]|nr:DUF3791 domain-containing protein [Clostridia bacterium]
MTELSILQKRVVSYIVACVSEFAERYNLDTYSAYVYLRDYKGIEYLVEFYDVLHTMSFGDAVDGMTDVCRNNGGMIS